MMTTIRYAVVVAAFLVSSAWPAHAAERPLPPSVKAAQLDKRIDWREARLIAVQDAGRYKTLDSFARESMSAMYGRECLPGLSPLASLLEWLFNRPAYADEPVVRIRDKGLRIHFSTHMPAAQRQFIIEKGYMTPRQLSERQVQDRMRELEPRFEMVSAMRRVRDAQGVAGFLDEMLFIVPPATPDPEEPWHLTSDLIRNLPEDLRAQAGATIEPGAKPVPGLSADQAVQVLGAWAKLRSAWLGQDAAGVQSSVDRLAQLLPTLAAAGVYPSRAQRSAEARYYAMGKFTDGWILYFLGAIASVWALVTRWRTPWFIALVLLVAAMAFHAYGIGLRWYILGRIPVANMFEAVISSAWIGIACALIGELIYRSRVFLFGATVTGFVALVLGGYVIPGAGTLTTIMGILDDVMLRIHTVLIIASYAMIFVAAVIAAVYLFAYYFHTAPFASLQMGAATAVIGAIIAVSAYLVFGQPVSGAAESVKRPGVAVVFWAAAVATLLAIAMLTWLRAHGATIFSAVLLLTAFTTIAIGNKTFVLGTGVSLLAAGMIWALGTGAGLLWRLVQGATSPSPALAAAGGPAMSVSALRMARPILAGGAPGDENRAAALPVWLHTVDWSQMIMLNLVFVLLFVGTILGAVWADYSWGRPWGWDPKEVFALNTWIVYAILIHARFLVKNKGLWTAWLSVAGCGMMAFNWCFVNFFIVGLHSYA